MLRCVVVVIILKAVEHIELAGNYVDMVIAVMLVVMC